MSYNWDEFKTTGGWITFENVGDTVVGTVNAIRTGKDFNGNPCPELIIEDDDGEERTLTAGQVMLKRALAEQAPQVGDRIRIKYAGVGDAKPGKAPAKLFEVAVKTGAGNTDPTAPTPQPAPVPADEVPF